MDIRIIDETRIQVLDIYRRGLWKDTSIRLQWKLWSGIQVCELVQRELHSEMYISTQSFFFEAEVSTEQWRQGME